MQQKREVRSHYMNVEVNTKKHACISEQKKKTTWNYSDKPMAQKIAVQ